VVCAAATQREAKRVGVFRANVADGILRRTQGDARTEQYDSRDQTAQLPYRKFEEGGRLDGHDLNDWLLGTRELRQARPDFEGMLFGLDERRIR
jgi:hypothetical protein